MSTLMTVAILGAAAIGEWSEGAIVVILFAISEALEEYSMNKARKSIASLMEIAPKEAYIKHGNQEILVPVENIQIGDIMIVKPGEKIAMDGIVSKGTSTINQAAITGESIPVTKSINDEVYAGTLNEDGLLEILVTKAFEDTTLNKIIHLVEEAQAEKAPTQQFVDRFAKYYTPAIILIALLIMILPPMLTSASWSEWFYRGLTVLVVGCPCALVISTPIAIVTAIGNAAKHGVLIKGGVHLENAGSLKVLAFDKTGTLTKGIPTVTDIISVKDLISKSSQSATESDKYISSASEETIKSLAITAAIEKGSRHPLATAIVRKADELNISYSDIEIDEFQSITGKGIKANVNNELYYIGSPKFFEGLQFNNDANVIPNIEQLINELQSQGKTVMLMGTKQDILLMLGVADEIRDSSKRIVEQLYQAGIEKTVMLTGDNKQTAATIANAVGITEYSAELLPEDKMLKVKELMSRYKKVGMVGDGVNDAPALAASNVGIAMGGAGTDTALETADIALMSDDLSKLPYTISLSRKALKIIKQNITFSIGIKVFALLLVIPGWLTLWLAIFADMGATLIVTLNSLRLLRINKS